mgnify:CR=1 FL=1|jgi:cell division protein FtsB
MSKLVDRLSRIAFILLIAGIVFAGVMASYPRYMRMKGLSQEKDRYLQLIEAKKAEIAELKEQQRRFSTDRGFVEKLARRNHLVYPGELVFIFDD